MPALQAVPCAALLAPRTQPYKIEPFQHLSNSVIFVTQRSIRGVFQGKHQRRAQAGLRRPVLQDQLRAQDLGDGADDGQAQAGARLVPARRPRRKRTQARAMSSADMPGPLSSTTSQAVPSPTSTRTVRSPPCGL